MFDKATDEAIDKLRATRTARILAAQRACDDEVRAAETAYAMGLDVLLDHNHPILARQDG